MRLRPTHGSTTAGVRDARVEKPERLSRAEPAAAKPQNVSVAIRAVATTDPKRPDIKFLLRGTSLFDQLSAKLILVLRRSSRNFDSNCL